MPQHATSSWREPDGPTVADDDPRHEARMTAATSARVLVRAEPRSALGRAVQRARIRTQKSRFCSTADGDRGLGAAKAGRSGERDTRWAEEIAREADGMEAARVVRKKTRLEIRGGRRRDQASPVLGSQEFGNVRCGRRCGNVGNSRARRSGAWTRESGGLIPIGTGQCTGPREPLELSGRSTWGASKGEHVCAGRPSGLGCHRMDHEERADRSHPDPRRWSSVWGLHWVVDWAPHREPAVRGGH
jgi:hypothetical protein